MKLVLEESRDAKFCVSRLKNVVYISALVRVAVAMGCS